jgi:hypothetical protein
VIATVVQQFDVIAKALSTIEPNDTGTFQKFTIYDVCEHSLGIVE